MNDLPPLPEGIDPTDGQSLIDWAEELGVAVRFEIVDRFPAVPLRLSEYTHRPPEIRIWRYLPWEPWLQQICENQVLMVAPWYLVYLTRELYRYLESHDLFAYRAPWYRLDLCWKWRNTEGRADSFTEEVLGLIRPSRRLDRAIAEALTFEDGSRTLPDRN